MAFCSLIACLELRYQLLVKVVGESGFFVIHAAMTVQFELRFSQEKMTVHDKNHVPLDCAKAPDFKVIQSEQSFFVLEAAFNVLTRKRHMQNAHDRYRSQCV